MKKMRINNRKTGILMSLALASIFMLVLSPMALASGGGDTHGEGGGEHVGWAATDWARVMNFVVLAVGLFLITRKPVAQMLSARIAGIKEQLDELEEQKAEAEKELARYNEKLTELTKEAEKIVDEYIRQGNEAKERILKEAESSAEKLEEKAKKNIEHEFKQARLTLQAEIIEKALVKAEADIISKISSDDQDRLVDEYLEKVVA